jgi:alkylhydroperoxidase family enzyme
MNNKNQYHKTEMNPIEDSPRVEPQSTSAMRPEWLATLQKIPGAGLKGDGFPHHVLGVLMHSPETLGPFLDYWVHCKTAMSLSVREQELVILRMACLYKSDYVWKHHVPVGREFGINDGELAAIRSGQFTPGFSPREESLLTLTDEMVEHRTIGSQAWQSYSGALSKTEIVDLISLVSQYVLFALMNNSMQVQIEEPLRNIPGIADT